MNLISLLLACKDTECLIFIESLQIFIPIVPWEVTTPTALPPGLRVIEDLVSPEEERQLLESIDWTEDEVIPNGI